MNAVHREALAAIIESGPIPATHGVVRWRLIDLMQWLWDEFALSVSKSPKPGAPAFLLHGMGDNVVPPIESEYLAQDLRGHAPVRLLLSGLISHADADQPARTSDVVALAGFWGDLLSR